MQKKNAVNESQQTITKPDLKSNSHFNCSTSLEKIHKQKTYFLGYNRKQIGPSKNPQEPMIDPGSHPVLWVPRKSFDNLGMNKILYLSSVLKRAKNQFPGRLR